jgi:hypothetical protein
LEAQLLHSRTQSDERALTSGNSVAAKSTGWFAGHYCESIQSNLASDRDSSSVSAAVWRHDGISRVSVASVLPRAESSISSGENSGKTPLPGDASLVAVLVQQEGQEEIAGATMVELR